MIDRVEAQKIAHEFANRYSRGPDDELVILDENVVERPYGWYFIPVSRRFLETGNFLDSITGPGPILVRNDTKEVLQFGSAETTESYIRQYEESMT